MSKKLKFLTGFLLTVSSITLFNVSMADGKTRENIIGETEAGSYEVTFNPGSQKEYLYIKVKNKDSNIWETTTLAKTSKSAKLNLKTGDNIKVYAKEFIGQRNEGIRTFSDFKDIEINADFKKMN